MGCKKMNEQNYFGSYLIVAEREESMDTLVCKNLKDAKKVFALALKEYGAGKVYLYQMKCKLMEQILEKM